jgi:hypothetical protein
VLHKTVAEQPYRIFLDSDTLTSCLCDHFGWLCLWKKPHGAGMELTPTALQKIQKSENVIGKTFTLVAIINENYENSR